MSGVSAWERMVAEEERARAHRLDVLAAALEAVLVAGDGDGQEDVDAFQDAAAAVARLRAVR